MTPPVHTLDDPAGWGPAVEDTEGPQLVLAGPGTGKTEFLARRVAHLIATGTPPEAIAVLTFSRRAAVELERRILSHLAGSRRTATASTFHSFAHRLVETHRARAGLPMPILLTGPEQVRLVGRLLAEEDPAGWPGTFRAIIQTQTLATEVADFVMRCQERLVDRAALEALAQDHADWTALPGFLDRYQDRLAAENRIDYGGLLTQAIAAAGVADQFTHVVVDEYQDTSPAQARLAETVAAATHHLTVAADPHQSIYSFRGADIDNVNGFAERVGSWSPAPRVIRLTRSLRVPREILDSARRLVAPNPPGPIETSDILPAAHSGAVEAYTFDQRSAEAEWIAAEVERLHITEDVPLHRMAVVVRSTRHLLPELSRALGRRQIPHDRSDSRLVDHPAIRLIVDLVTAAIAPPDSSDNERAVTRLLLGPMIRLALGQQRRLLRLVHHRQTTWSDVIRSELPESAALADLIDDPRWATQPPAVDGFWHLWDSLPHLDEFVADPARADYRAAWSTFARMLERQAERDASISLVESLQATLAGDFEANPLLSFSRPDTDRLVVTTLHQAKGLEFDFVFIADATEGVFPATTRWRSLLQPDLLRGRTDAAQRTQFQLAEERRLAYTATTRARRRVVWTSTTAGIDEGDRRPSRFILPAVGADSFDDLGPPPVVTQPGFQPLTPTDAQARLRRHLADPAQGPVERLAALSVLAGHAGWDAGHFAGVPEPGPDTGVITANLSLSPSQATLYEKCPRQYVLDRRLRTMEAESPYMLFGSILHEILELAEKEAKAEGLSHATLADARRILDEVWEQEARFGTPEQDFAWKARAGDLLEMTYGDWPGGGDPAVALEIDLSTTIGGVTWIGRADRIDLTPEGLKIVDYKTSKTGPTLKDAAVSRQLGFYILAARAHPELAAIGDATSAELWYLLADKRRTFPFDIEKLDEVEAALEEIAIGIRSEDWTPKLGAHCQRCNFRLVCPAWPDGREYA